MVFQQVTSQWVRIAIQIEPETLFKNVRWYDINLSGDTPQNHHNLGKLGVYDTRNIIWIVASHLLFLVLWSWSWEKSFIKEEVDFPWFNRMSQFVQKFLYFCQTVFSRLFCKKSTFTSLVWLVEEVLIQGQHLFSVPKPAFSGCCWMNSVPRTQSVRLLCFFPTSHGLIVSVVALHFKTYCFHGAERALSSCHDYVILMPGTNQHDAGHPFSIFRWLPPVYVKTLVIRFHNTIHCL